MDIWTSFFKSNDFIPLIKEPLLILDGKKKKYGSLNSLGKIHFELHVLLSYFPSMVKSNVHYIRKSMNLYFEIALYVAISNIDPREVPTVMYVMVISHVLVLLVMLFGTVEEKLNSLYKLVVKE
jgi:hypothetical protein